MRGSCRVASDSGESWSAASHRENTFQHEKRHPQNVKMTLGQIATTSTETGCVGLEDKSDVVARFSKGIEDFLIAAGRVGRICKSPMVPMYLPRKHRAGLVGIPADRNRGANILRKEEIHVLRGVGGEINPDLSHDFDSYRMHEACWL